MVFPPVSDIRRRRLAMGVTQMELAMQSGVSQSTIAKIEHQKTVASYDTVVALFEALDGIERSKVTDRTAGEVCTKEVIAIQENESVGVASAMMSRLGFSQLPVFDGDHPVGSISEKFVVDHLQKGGTMEQLARLEVKDVMGASFPVVPDSTPMRVVAGMMGTYNAVLVSMRGTITGVITKADLLKLL